MITDESFEKFYDFSSVNKEFKEEFLHSEAFTKATAALSKPVFDFDMGLDKIKMLKHFLIRHNDLNQLVMSSFNYFGRNEKQFKGILNQLQSQAEDASGKTKRVNCWSLYSRSVLSILLGG
jgi:replication initiation and membrane attachment protein DnaB